ncbi:MAG TPA: TraB/GumN family protein [Chitinophagaceae bacterium]|nr:TraB/GumN family protein [Chitinophagaceae bacterium]
MTMLTPAMKKLYAIPEKLALLLLFAVASLCAQGQKKSLENTLLWKISGSNLAKPSYLYGTIHVQDKRVFNFSDSLYRFIQSADGFAMEIHPDSVVMAIMQNINKSATNEYLKKYLKKDEFDALNVKLRKELGIDADKLTVKETYMLRQHLAKPERKPDDMPTIVDAYLYGMAKNQGKEIAGLERAIDQVNLLNDMRVEDFNPSRILKSLKKEQTLIEKIIQLYIREDLKGIGELMSMLPDQTEDRLLSLRNELMATKMDSMMREKSYVVAVGTAHLPGEKGIIELLRQKGYTVEPVFTTSRTHANNYSIKAQQLQQWVEVKEPTLGYSARMPGKPSPMDMLNGVMKMNMYIDMTSMKQYYTAFVLPAITITNSNADSVLQQLYKNMVSASMGEAISDKRFTRNGFEAIDMLYKIPAENIHARVQSFAFGKRVYLIGMGARNKDDLYGKEATDYFEAFIIEKMPEQQWQRHTFNDHFFSVIMPETPKGVDVETPDSSIVAVQFNSLDNSKGNFYGVMAVKTAPGFVIPDDSAYFVSAIERLNATMDLSNLRLRDTTFQGFFAKWIVADLKDNTMLKCLSIIRGNRVYSLMVTGNQEDSASADIANFYNSFAFLDYPAPVWKQEQFEEHGFAAPVPGSFSRTDFLDFDSSTAIGSRDYLWVAFDAPTVTSFTVTRRALSKYLWAKHDSVILKKYMNELVERNEMLGPYQFIRNGNSNGVEFTVSSKTSGHVQRFRVLLNGKFVYMLQANAPEKYWKQYEFQRFHTGFRFLKEEKTDFIYSNSLDKLVKDLASTDSATYAQAFEAIESVVYEPADIPAMLRAAVGSYPLDTLRYRGVNDAFLRSVRALKHDDFEKLILEHYRSLNPGQEKFKYSTLTILSQRHTEKSYRMLAELLNERLPTHGNDVSMFVYGFTDSLELTKRLYPQLWKLSADTLLGTPLFLVHERMLDSSLLSVDELKAHEAIILQAGRNELAKILKHKEEYYYATGTSDLIESLGKLKSNASIGLLREFLKTKYTNLQFDAVLELLKLKQPVEAAILSAIAADKYYRVSLYEELKKLKMERAFPSKYLSQRAFAESYLVNNLEYDPDKMEYVGERTAFYKGKRCKFYLFKATLEYNNEKTSYLCVSGPFSLDAEELTITENNNISGMYEENEFKTSEIDKHFKAYLEDWESYDTMEYD